MLLVAQQKLLSVLNTVSRNLADEYGGYVCVLTTQEDAERWLCEGLIARADIKKWIETVANSYKKRRYFHLGYKGGYQL